MACIHVRTNAHTHIYTQRYTHETRTSHQLQRERLQRRETLTESAMPGEKCKLGLDEEGRGKRERIIRLRDAQSHFPWLTHT
eukprot:325279-Rhodomonas_salina.4